MNYPMWVVPLLGGSWVVGIMAIIHVFISHFAVGGGAFLALTEEVAYRRKDERMFGYLKQHSRFFVLITTVAGAVTGVGIWFTVSLVSPDGIGTLIQCFTLAWALEYLFFAAELATAFAYYYTWDKISPEKHLMLARLYFWLSVATLFIINGMLTFMLTPGKWLTTHYWFDGFFNSTYFPSFIIRLLMMFALAGMYGLVTSSRIRDLELRTYMVRYCAKWLIPIFVIGPLVCFWFLSQVPQATIHTIFTGIQTSGVGNFSVLARALYLSLVLSGTILLFAFIGPYLNPKGFTFRIALVFLVFGLTVTGTTEWMRELLRKPYVVYDYLYSNAVHKDALKELGQSGFLSNARWAAVAAEPATSDVAKGEVMFRFQCMSCHTVRGYRAIETMLGERDEGAITGFLHLLKIQDKAMNPYSGIMPPLIANEEELKCLAKYLATINAVKKAEAATAAH